RLAQLHIEAPDAEPDQRCLHPVHDPAALANQILPLAARPLGVFLRQRRDRRHAAVLRFASPRSQPKKARLSKPTSSRSVFARRCSRWTGMLAAWIT